MANADKPSGLTPRCHRSGAPYNGAFTVYDIPASDGTALFIGDPVIMVGTGDSTGKYNGVIQAATGGVICGVVVGFEPLYSNLETKHRLASTNRKVFVCDNPDVLFSIQEVSGGTALATTAIGLNVDFVVAAGSTISGLSGVELNNATEATTNTLDLKIHRLLNVGDNALGEHAKWLVSINRHQFANQVAGI